LSSIVNARTASTPEKAKATDANTASRKNADKVMKWFAIASLPDHEDGPLSLTFGKTTCLFANTGG
jgi:hypothetical protein